jgi:hypothetical protein
VGTEHRANGESNELAVPTSGEFVAWAQDQDIC